MRLVHQALVFIEADVKDVATAVLEVEFDYFRDNDQNGTGVNEAYIRIDNFTGDADPDDGFTFVAGRFNLPFGEYYSFEDPPGNFMIGLPILMPYRWDEGIMVYGSGAPGGFVVALTEGTYDRASSTGLSPALTARLHTEPTENLYISVSGHFANETPASALCLGGSVITPVGGGSAGASPSSTVDALLGVVNVQWQATSSLWIHASAGVAQVDDRVDSFDREFGWWTLEPSWEIDETWRATLRWSGVSTFDAGEGYQFEGRPYGNGVATYGFDLTRAQRLAACVTCTFAPGLIGKIEAGFDDFVATNQSALPDDTREFFAAELVLSF